jgi:hypothetical protein
MAFQSFGGRFVFSCVCAALVAGLAACGGQGSSGDLDKIDVAISRFDITVTNKAGRALMEVRVEILPVGKATAYTARIARMENGEKRSLGFTMFSDRSAIQFSPRTAKPQTVKVSAADMEGKPVQVQVPWTQQ